MIKLVYDLKAGFDDCYLIIKNEAYDLSYLCEHAEESADSDDVKVAIDSEEENYNYYKVRMNRLMQFLDNSGDLASLQKESMAKVSKLFFSYRLNGNDLPIWEPSNFRLEYNPEVRSPSFYADALPAKEVCELLKLTRQQLHYYVKTGAIKKEFNPDKPNSFKYNWVDVYVLQKKLEKKYEKCKQ